MIEILLQALLVIVFLGGCGASKSNIADNPASQRFRDVTGKLFPRQSSLQKQAIFFRADQNALPDLVILSEAEPGKSQLQIFINHGEKGFQPKDSGRWIEELKAPILSIATADLNRDGGDELILLVKESSGRVYTQILFNNRKGYFYAKNKEGKYSLWPGIDGRNAS